MTEKTKHSIPLIMGTALTVVGIAALAAAFVLYGKGGATPVAAPAFEAEATALRGEREKLLAEKGQMEERIKQLLAELATEKEKLASAEEFMAVQRNANEPLRQELVRFKGLYEQALSDIARAENSKNAAEKAREASEAKLAQALSDMTRLEDAKKEAEKAREESETKLAQLQAAGEAVSTKVADLEKEVAAAKERVENTSKALALREEEKSELEAKARELEVALDESRQENNRLAASVETVEAEKAMLRSEVESLKKQTEVLNARIVALEALLTQKHAVTEGEGEK